MDHMLRRAMDSMLRRAMDSMLRRATDSMLCVDRTRRWVFNSFL
jgi:hypothetical protein